MRRRTLALVAVLVTAALVARGGEHQPAAGVPPATAVTDDLPLTTPASTPAPSPPDERQITLFQPGHGWSGEPAGAVVDDPDVPARGSQSLRLTCPADGGTAWATAPRSAPLDLSARHPLFEVRADDVTRLDELSLTFGSGSTPFAAGSRISLVSATPAPTPWLRSGRWTRASLSRADVKTTSGTGVAWSRVQDLRIRVSCRPGQPPARVWVQRVASFRQPPRGVVSVSFDDALESQATLARPLLEEAGLPATYYVIDEAVDTGGHLTSESLARMRDAGASIAMHSYASATHAQTFSRLSPADLDVDLRSALAWQVRGGFPSAGNLAYPSGAWNEGVEAVVRRYARTARTTFHPSSLGVARSETFPAGEPLLRRAWSVHDDDTPADLIAAVAKAAAANEHLELVFHDLTTGSPGDQLTYRIADFRTLMQDIAARRAAGTIDVLTPAALYGG